MKLYAPLSLALLSIGISLGSQTALAGIGQQEASAESDARVLQGAHRLLDRSNFRIHEIKTEAQIVREYAAPDGKVFAVTWQGLGEPSLEGLFGPYYKEYRDGDFNTKTPKGRLPKKIETANLVVLKFGQMRNVHGKAYAPKLVPQGFDLRDLL